MKSFSVTTTTNLRDFTDSTYPQGSFYFSTLLKGGDIRVNGSKVRSNCPLAPGDSVVYYTTPKMEAKPSHQAIYAGQQLFAADKFSGVCTEALACELGLIPVHRLDRNTCGVLLFARTENCARAVMQLFRQRLVTKKYICICKDNFTAPAACLTAYLKKDSARSLASVLSRPQKGYVPIVTQYRVLQRQAGLARVEVTLHTGKTHQIRAHLAHIGCPVLGDQKYGLAALNRQYGLARQQLCSWQLAFELDGRQYSFQSSLAPNFPTAERVEGEQ